MIGKRLAHYEILAQLGKGGMGEVYRARDTRLGREVALKLLPAEMSADPDRRKRFAREAQAIAALKHPNIVTIYAVEESDGEQFITMELVEGETLASRIPDGGVTLEQFFAYAIPLADAISNAHEHGITHRDLKPANIMFDKGGRLKILDFGLAKLLGTDEQKEQDATLAMVSDTAAGLIMGTAAYMSPEQAEGKPVDSRSDIFSLGILLYEMATGVRPFQGDTQISTISAILKDQPQLVSEVRRQVPRHLGRIVNRCLEKNPDSRYQTAKDVCNELTGLKRELDSGDLSATMEGVAAQTAASSGGNAKRILIGLAAVVVVAAGLFWGLSQRSSQQAAPAPVPSELAERPDIPAAPAKPSKPERQMVVVLPFENLGPPEDAYFAAGMTDEITSRISTVGDLGVISRSSATQYDRTGKSMRQIGEDLGVDFVLEGTVRWAKTADGKGRVRITPQLIRVEDDSQMWAQTYDREILDIFEVQTEIASRMIAQLGVTLTSQEQQLVADAPTNNLEAYTLFLQAEELYRNDFLRADSLYVELMQQALALDPGFVDAWAKLASFHLNYYAQNFDKSNERMAKARQALRQAERLGPDHVETLVSRGGYYYYGFDDYEQALREFEAAVQLSPNHSLARLQIGNIHRRLGNWEQCVENQQMAMRIDPKSTNNRVQLGSTYAGLRRFEEALLILEPLLNQSSSQVEQVAGLVAEIRWAWKGDLSGFRDLIPDSPLAAFLRARYYFLQGDFKEATRQVHQFPELRMDAARRWKLNALVLCEFYERGVEGAEATLLEAQALLEEHLDLEPSNNDARNDLAITLAFLGRRDAAVREAKLAVEQRAKDKFFGPNSVENLAMVYAILGEQEPAIALIEELLSTVYDSPLTPHVLRTDARWTNLRNHPRFQALVRDEI